MVQTKIWQMTLSQNLILFTNHYGNLQEMLEMASFLKYLDLYLTSGAGFTWDTLYKLFFIQRVPFKTQSQLLHTKPFHARNYDIKRNTKSLQQYPVVAGDVMLEIGTARP
jgi:hypothetical protein